jgi:hypothetical protein
MLAQRRSSLRIQVPVKLERSIRVAINNEYASKTSANETLASRMMEWLRRPAVSFGAVAAVLVAAVAIAVLGTGPSGLSHEITHAALEVFPGVHSGSTPLDVASGDKATITAYLAEHGVQHKPFYPEVDAQLVGANVFTVNGLACAEIVYKKAGHTIALLEVDEAAVESKKVEIDSVIENDVEQSRWHWAATQENGTLFVWKSNSIMCTVVSDLQIDAVSSLFNLGAL